ncbi:hypothetical protein [Enterobacter roggenkampii]|uniref:hypothetical protein n=1 Tax=Enterobacter roggenkampii TaxID=1812935 RepID=UPI0020068D39|nr:hypothetical protein [Enterobacter roggenkampii]MCK7405542.1 hypothetical protein [Enterobacter roggenkampii]
MSKSNKQWLQQKIAEMEAARDEIPFGLNEDHSNTLAALRIALASLEAEAVGYMNRFTGRVFTLEEQPGADTDVQVYVAVYTAPPSPECLTRPVHPRISSEELDDETLDELIDFRRCTFEYHSQQDNKVQTIIHGVTLTAMLELRERRAAMLQGADGNSPVITDWQTQAEKMAELYGSSFVLFRNGESPQCADPTKVIISFTDEGLGHGAEAPFRENAETSTKCWCRTCRPVTISDMRFVVCPECGNKRCPHANDHRNACTGSNEPGQEGSAYPAAPRQEV